MPKTVVILTAKRKGEAATRFVIGCMERVKDLHEQLLKKKYKVVLELTETAPQRSEEERRRATTIVGQIYGT